MNTSNAYCILHCYSTDIRHRKPSTVSGYCEHLRKVHVSDTPPANSLFRPLPTSSTMIVIMGCESRVDRTEECLRKRGGRGKRPAALQSPNSLGDDGTRLQTYCGSLRKTKIPDVRLSSLQSPHLP